MLDTPAYSPYFVILSYLPLHDRHPRHIPTVGPLTTSLRNRHYSSASAHSARIPTRPLSLEGHWLEIRSFTLLDDTYPWITHH